MVLDVISVDKCDCQMLEQLLFWGSGGGKPSHALLPHFQGDMLPGYPCSDVSVTEPSSLPGCGLRIEDRLSCVLWVRVVLVCWGN